MNCLLDCLNLNFAVYPAKSTGDFRLSRVESKICRSGSDERLEAYGTQDFLKVSKSAHFGSYLT